MTYTEKELDQFLHGISLSLLSKKSAQHWRYDEETAKEIEWLEVLERKVRADKADRKTEPQICETCRHWKYIAKEWQCEAYKCQGYEPKTEPQTIRCPKCGRSDYIREFGKDFSVTAEEAGFKYKCINCNTYIEPQTDCSWK